MMAELALALCAAVIGGVATFGGVVTPTAFRVLGENSAGPMVRAVFPRLYIVMAGVCVLALILAAIAQSWVAAALIAANIMGFLASRYILIPMVNAARDAEDEGRFSALHSATVRLTLGQLGGLALACVFLALA